MSTQLSITIELLRDIHRQQAGKTAAGVARSIAHPKSMEEFLRQIRETRPPSRETAISQKPTIENL
jgi:hypothetical protein